MSHLIRLRVNGAAVERQVEPRKLLVDFLREDLGLVGVHVGCDTGYCGACNVLLDGDSVRACNLLAIQADGAEVFTVEGLSESGDLRPLQEAFREHHGLQCGYCTPGMLVAAYDFLRKNPDPDEAEIRDAISGCLCRCTGYVNIVRSIAAAARAGGGL